MKRYLFVRVPKTGSTSMFIALGQPGINRRRSGNWNIYSRFKFAFVRNPYDRMVSLYHFTNSIARDPKHKFHQRYKNFDIGGLNEFCSNFHNHPSIIMDLFMSPQWYFVRPIGKTSIDFIGRFENIDNDWKKLCSLIDKEHTPLKRHNSTKHGCWKDVLSEESKKNIRRWYIDDFENLGYDK